MTLSSMRVVRGLMEKHTAQHSLFPPPGKEEPGNVSLPPTTNIPGVISGKGGPAGVAPLYPSQCPATKRLQ